jgi:predicted metalloprotease
VRDIRGQGRGGGGFGLPGLGGGGGFGPSGGGGGGGLPIPAGGSIGSLVIIVIVIIVFYFLTRGGDGGTGVTNPGNPTAPAGSGAASECLTGEQANERMDCRIVGFTNSIQAYWTDYYASRGETYDETQTTLFTEFVETGCGGASAQVGPFYCPADRLIFIELGFFNVLETQYGASGGSLAQGYVVAHEYGHHIQNLTGVLQRSQDGTTGPQSSAVRVELQADCYAGVWVGNAVDTELLEPITQSQLQDALSAAAAVGDDRIQEKATGQVNPEAWTHGSAAQRQAWFTTGYRTGDPASCDTFAGRI